MAKQRSTSQQAYCQSVGTSPTGAPIIDSRDPNVNDVFYPIGQFWINQIGIRLFYLNTQSNVTGKLQSTWQLLSVQSTIASISDTANLPVFASSTIAIPPANIQLLAGSGISVVSNPALNLLTIANTGIVTESLTGDDTVAVSSIAGTIRTLGNTVANATFAKALFTNNPSTNIEQFNIQVATKLPATDATLSKVGLSVFSSAQFNVDVNGFVTLIGGSTSPMLSITPNTFTAPGTSPTLPTGTGTLTIQGGTHFVTGTQAFPIRTDSLAANTINIEIQEAGSNAAVSTPNKFGVAQFDSNQFNVASGFVQLVGGSVLAIQTITGNDLVALSGSGTPRNVNIVGTANQITTSGAVSTMTLSTPVIFIAPGSITSTTTTTVTSGNLTVTAGNAVITAGNITLPNTNASGTQGLLSLGGLNFLNNLGTQNAFGGGAGNLTLTVANAQNNTAWGFNALLLLSTGTQNAYFGFNSGRNTSSGSYNNGFGAQTLAVMTTGGNNVAVGNITTANLVTGNFNTVVGSASGNNYTTSESNNIIVGYNVTGVALENSVTRIGSGQTACYISGIDGVNVGSVARIVTEASNQLGTAIITAGAGISVTPSANAITISATGAGFTWIDQTVDLNPILKETGYFADKASRLILTLPTNAVSGDTYAIAGFGVNGWQLNAGVGQTINFGSVATTVAGNLQSTNQWDGIEIVCSPITTTFIVRHAIGNLTLN